MRGSFRAPWLKQLGDESGPAGLMASAEPLASLSVKILVEQEAVAKMRILLELAVVAEDGSLAVRVAEEQFCQAIGDLVADGFQREILPRSGWALDKKIVAVVVMKLLYRLDN